MSAGPTWVFALVLLAGCFDPLATSVPGPIRREAVPSSPLPSPLPLPLPVEMRLPDGPSLPDTIGLPEQRPRPRCGDGNVDTREICDDGNTAEDDSCVAQCSERLCRLPERQGDLAATHPSIEDAVRDRSCYRIVVRADIEGREPLVVDRALTIEGLWDRYREPMPRVTPRTSTTWVEVVEGGDLRMKGLEIANATSAECGGVLRVTTGALSLEGVQLSDNHSDDRGGAICVMDRSVATLQGSLLVRNQAPLGGAIYVAEDSYLETRGSHFFQNRSTEQGGAVAANASVLFLEASKFDGNAATGPDPGSAARGGALATTASDVEIRDCELHGNTADAPGGADGGAIAAQGVLRIEHSYLRDNVVQASGHDAHGGAIHVEGSFELLRSTLSANRAESVETVDGLSGAVTSAIFARCTDETSSSLIENSTLHGNFSVVGGLGVPHAVFFSSGSGEAGCDARILGSTITDNRANIALVFGMRVRGEVRHSIVTGHPRGCSVYDGPLSFSHNLWDTGSCESPAVSATVPDPRLLPLSTWGDDWVPVRVPRSGSEAIDIGDADCAGLSSDQTGTSRPLGQGCDAGAVESSFECGNLTVEPGEACDDVSEDCTEDCQSTICRVGETHESLNAALNDVTCNEVILPNREEPYRLFELALVRQRRLYLLGEGDARSRIQVANGIVLDAATLMVENVAFEGAPELTEHWAIFVERNPSDLTLRHCRVSGLRGPFAGVLHQLAGQLTVSDSEVEDNEGMILSMTRSGRASILGSTFERNRSGPYRSAIVAGSGEITIADSEFRENRVESPALATVFSVGAILRFTAASAATIHRCWFDRNVVSGNGIRVPIFASDSHLTVTNSMMVDNESSGNSTYRSSGILCFGGSMRLVNTTLYANSAVGATGTVEASEGCSAVVLGSTLVDNDRLTNAPTLRAVGTASITAHYSILGRQECLGQASSDGNHNLLNLPNCDASAAPTLQVVSLPDAWPVLAPTAGSPAIDICSGDGCLPCEDIDPLLAYDALGARRPEGNSCDAGAIEGSL